MLNKASENVSKFTLETHNNDITSDKTQKYKYNKD
jgi:hypothetical protein